MAEVAPWQVYDQAYYATFAADKTSDTDMGVSMLIPLDAANRSSGAFLSPLTPSPDRGGNCIREDYEGLSYSYLSHSGWGGGETT